MIMTPITGIQYPMPNKEYPIMKAKAATRAIPPLGLGNSLLDIGYSSFSSPPDPTQHPIMKAKAATRAIPPLDLGYSLLDIGHSSFSSPPENATSHE